MRRVLFTRAERSALNHAGGLLERWVAAGAAAREGTFALLRHVGIAFTIPEARSSTSLRYSA